MKITPASAWNKAPKVAGTIANEESWTQNGLLLDSIRFVGGVPSGQPIAKQPPKSERQVPAFRAEMTPQDLVSMLESYYRVSGVAKVFSTTSVAPVTFLGESGMQFDYDYVGADDVKRRGRSMIVVVNDKLYLMSLDGTALHYFDAALPEFVAMAASAKIS